MKKLFSILLISGSVVIMASCDYDDSNDIDYIIPNDSTATGNVTTNLPQ